MSVGAIIVAAGRGERAGTAVPKQFLEIDGESVLRRSVRVFDAHADVTHLVVVLPESYVADAAALVGPTARPCRCVAGGKRRQDSVRRGLAAMPDGPDLILVHDAARPFADRALVDRVIAAAAESGAAVPATPARDTIKRVDVGRGIVRETIAREEIWMAQTPQGFRRDVLAAAMDGAGGSADATDEAAIVERAGHAVRVVAGDVANVKITTPEDVASVASHNNTMTGSASLATRGRVGTGYDLHRLVEGRPLVLAGITVPFHLGPHGHSDGDVLCHALVDALLGACGLGDIGRHFPNTDPRWKDAAGLDLLGRAVAEIRAAGFAPVNADVTVILERPKLAPHIDAMRGHLARVLGVAVSDVSVKGKTNEGVDAVGRGEAIAAHAVAFVSRSAREPR